MPQENISEYLNPYRFPRMAFGLKANSTLNRITQTPQTQIRVRLYILKSRNYQKIWS